jgi:hypothetical protein
VVADATGALAAAGFRPRVRTGDGAAGWPSAAPFDRILATCSVDRIPPGWIEQLAPGGRIVAPLTFGGALAVLDKAATGEVSGRIDATAVYFMPLRERLAQAKPDDIAPVPPPEGGAPYRGVTELDPEELEPARASASTLREVTQHGRRLWDTVEAAWSAWQRCGRPRRDRLRLVARTDGTQHCRLDDDPDRRYCWPLPGR